MTRLNKTIKDRKQSIKKLLEQIEKSVECTPDDTKNWGYAGNLGHVLSELEEVSNFIK